MNLAEQMQAQIALNKALPLIQMQLTNNSFGWIAGVAYSKWI